MQGQRQLSAPSLAKGLERDHRGQLGNEADVVAQIELMLRSILLRSSLASPSHGNV